MANKNLEGKFVKIDAHDCYIVTPSLSYYDQTDVNTSNPNKLRIIPNWVRKEVMLEAGTHWYPAEITEWNTVKSLSDNAKITIGEIRDSISNTTEKSNAEKISDDLKRAEVDIARQEAKINAGNKKKIKSMADIAASVE